jgi:serine protease Do
MTNSAPPPRRPVNRPALITSTSAAALIAVIIASATLMHAPSPAVAAPPPLSNTASVGPMVIADLVDKVKPAVVAIKVSIKTALDSDETGQADIPKGSPLERFFKRFGDQSAEDGESEMPHKGRQQVQAQGSGFFISADGFIVTNNHVVDKAIKVSVVLEDGRTLDAKIIGRDAKTDLALLKVEAPGPYPFVPLAGAAPRVGENVIAIGNPYGLGGTVTSGIVSARGRDIGSGPYDDFIQIDAAVNRGNSGGPTFNLQGEVVGVNTAIYSPTGGSIGLGFAVPSRTVLQVVEQIKQHGSVERGYLGVRTQSVTQELAEGLGLTEVKGALVDHAEKGTPAAKAGLKAGDVIVAVNSELITDARDLARKVAGITPGAAVKLDCIRDGKSLAVQLTLAAVPSAKTAKADIPEAAQMTPTGFGFSLAPTDEAKSVRDSGVEIADVEPDGAAAKRGLREGDVIVEIAGKAVNSPVEATSALSSAKAGARNVVLMKVKSMDDGPHFVAVPVPKT